MSGTNQIETIFLALLGRAPLPHERQAYEGLEETPQALGLQIMASQEFRRRALLGAFSAGSTQWVCAEIRDGLKIWVDLLDVGVSAGAIADNWEPAETDFILSILRKGGAFIDIGAHIGWFTILGAQKVGPEGRVYAFEPRPAIFDRLRASVGDNGFQDRCILHCVALSDRASTVSMATFDDAFNSGHAVMVTGAAPEDASLVGDIPAIILDGLVWDRRIDLIKMDVEGAEAMVLRGGRELLMRDQPIIVSEFFPAWLRDVSGVSPDGFMASLKELGYRVFELTPQGVGREIHALERNRAFGQDYFTNIVALTDAHIDRYLLRPLDGRVRAYEAALARLQSECATERAAHARMAEESDASIARLRAERAAEEAVLACQREMMARSERDFQGLQGNADNRIRQLVRENNALIVQVRNVHEQLAALTAQRDNLHASNIWRACVVLMRAARRIPLPVRTLLVRSTKLGWWTLTGQLPQRLQAWRQIRRNAALAAATAPSACQMADSVGERARWAGRRGPVVLVVDDRWPEPDRDSGSVDAVNLVRHLVAMGFEVAYAVASDLIQDDRYRDELVALGATVAPQNGPGHIRKYIEDNRNIFSLVVLSRVTCGGALFEFVRHNCPDAKIIFNTVDLFFLREQRAARLSGDQEAIERAGHTRDREEWLVGHADLTIVVSETEREILSVAVPRAPVRHLPLARDIAPPTAPFSARRGIGFVGGFAHQPNLDAVRWFLAEIWPLVRRQSPDLILTIVGKGLPDGIAKAEDGVTYLGPVDDLHAWFETLRASVAPLRFGAGAKGKVASSLANGVPCVLSVIAAEGMALVDGESVLIAETPEMFADRIVSVTSDAALWQKISTGGLAMAQRYFSHRTNLCSLHEALIGLGVPVPEVFPGDRWQERCP